MWGPWEGSLVWLWLGGTVCLSPPPAQIFTQPHIPIAFIMEGVPCLPLGAFLQGLGVVGGSGEGVKVGHGMGMEGRDGAEGTALEGWR